MGNPISRSKPHQGQQKPEKNGFESPQKITARNKNEKNKKCSELREINFAKVRGPETAGKPSNGTTGAGPHPMGGDFGAL